MDNRDMTLMEYAEACIRIIELARLDPEPASPEGLELLRLVDIVEPFERAHFTIEGSPLCRHFKIEGPPS